MNYHEIEKCSISNGTGFRTVLWISGCSLNCKGCHNQQAQDKNSGKLFDENAKEELFDSINHEYIRGVTLSGGHPLEPYNLKDVVKLMKEIKERFPDKDIWVYTGYTFSVVKNKMSDVLKYADVIVDGRYIEELRDITLKFRGSSNQRIWVNTDKGWVDTTVDRD